MSHELVTLARHGELAVVTIDNPPVNASGHAVRAGLAEAVRTIAAEPKIRGAVLRCAGRTFVAGADITEFGQPPAAPTLRDVAAALEDLGKPVVALLHGTALGGGLELALGCPYRVIDPAGAVGLPEVTLGLVPGAGGTQRLPRLIGVAAALDLIASGRRVPAREALALGIVDAITEGDRLAFALAFLRGRLDGPPPRIASRPIPVTDPDVIERARAAVAKRMPGQIAPARAIDLVVESADRSFAEGLGLEQRCFEALRDSPQAQALRHIFFAERAISKVPGRGTARPIETVGIAGGGTMGAAIAAACLLSGLVVCLVERDDAAVAAGRARVAGILDEAVKRGKLTASERAAMGAGRFMTGTETKMLAAADLIVEAVFESLTVKQEVFRDLDRIARPDAVLATNTSYLDVAAIAASTRRPGEVIGLHFFSPAHVMKLLEIIVPAGADPDAVATGFAFAKRLGKLGVWAGNAEGFIGNRILSAYRRAADQMVEDGASPFAVDAALVAFGFPMGLYAMQDMAGLEIGWATRRRLAPTRDPAERYVAIGDRICEQGWFGRKTGRGYYVYEPGAAPRPNPDVDAIVAKERSAKGIAPRRFTSADIQDRILLATVNEGCKILDDGIALRTGDIDVVMVNGYGYPRWRGGPMQAGGARGWAEIRDAIAVLASPEPLWRISPTLAALARGG